MLLLHQHVLHNHKQDDGNKFVKRRDAFYSVRKDPREPNSYLLNQVKKSIRYNRKYCANIHPHVPAASPVTE